MTYYKHSTFILIRPPEGRWGWEVAGDGYGVFLWGDENVLEFNGDIGGMTLNIIKPIELYTLKR